MPAILTLKDEENPLVSCEVGLCFSESTNEILLISIHNGWSGAELALELEATKKLRDHLSKLIKEME